MRAAILGIEGPSLATAESALFSARPPAGVILFSRNIENPPQLARLVASLRAILPPEAVMMVDQEGGRVARLRPPHWRKHPPAAALGRLYDIDRPAGLRAAWLSGALIAQEAGAAGFDVVTNPVLDLGLPSASTVIGDRAFHADPRIVARLGRAFAQGTLAAGIQPVMKHIPGHGRAQVDSHFTLPVVEEKNLAADLFPFVANRALPWAMTAHIRYTRFDNEHPATLSQSIIRTVIRDRVRFDGLLVSDDLAMQALTGTPGGRAAAALAAGCDLACYCSGEKAANEEILSAVPEITPEARTRLDRARALAVGRRLAAASRQRLDPGQLSAERDRLLARTARDL